MPYNHRPKWTIEIEKILIENNIKKKDLAETLDLNYRKLINVMNGYTPNNTLVRLKVCKHFGREDLLED